MRASRGIVCAIVLIAFAVAPASADHVFGIKGSIEAIDSGAQKVTINVTQYVEDYDGSDYGFGASYYPAIAWGDGSSLAYGTLDYVGAGPNSTAKYSAQFMHTYPDTSDRTITLGATCCANDGFTTGNSPRGTSESPLTLTNTLEVGFEPVPTLPNYGYPLLLLSLLLAGAGALMLRG